ncbi:MAG: fatty acid desaturase [Kiritimatiellia bacterium]
MNTNRNGANSRLEGSPGSNRSDSTPCENSSPFESIRGSNSSSAPDPRAIPGGLNLIILLLQLAALTACFTALPRLQSPWAVAGLAVVFGVVMNSVYSIIHEAEHSILFRNRLANDFGGVFMSLFFPAPYHLIRQGHLGHHLRNRSDDEAFDLYFEDDHKLWRFLVFYGILTGGYYLVVVLSNVVFLFLPFRKDKKYWDIDSPTRAFIQSLNPRYRHLIRLEGASAILLHTGIVWGLDIPVARYLAMYAGFGIMWSAMQYVHHYGTERHVTRGARNLWIWRPLDLVWLNHNWHLRHHEHPSVPWIHLHRLDDGPDAPRGFLLRAYLRMWGGPKKADQRVPNRHDGKIIP